MKNAPVVATELCGVRKAVGVLDNVDALQGAIQALEMLGFDLAEISVLGSEAALRDWTLYRSGADIEASESGARRASVITHGNGDAAGPLFIGTIPGDFAVVASSAAIAAAFASAIAAGGAGLGEALARVVSRRHAEQIKERLIGGSLVLWVTVRDEQNSVRALETLINAGARDAHEHKIERGRILADRLHSRTLPKPVLSAATLIGSLLKPRALGINGVSEV